jgi:hypothetical protein
MAVFEEDETPGIRVFIGRRALDEQLADDAYSRKRLLFPETG